MRHVIEKALPLPFPHTLVLPPQGATERTPEMGVEEAFVNLHGAEDVQSEDTSPQTGFAVFACVLVSTCSGFGQCLLHRHNVCSLHLPRREPPVLILRPTSEK